MQPTYKIQPLIWSSFMRLYNNNNIAVRRCSRCCAKQKWVSVWNNWELHMIPDSKNLYLHICIMNIVIYAYVYRHRVKIYNQDLTLLGAAQCGMAGQHKTKLMNEHTKCIVTTTSWCWWAARWAASWWWWDASWCWWAASWCWCYIPGDSVVESLQEETTNQLQADSLVVLYHVK